MATIQQMLRPNQLTRVISRIVGGSDALLDFVGMNPGGRNEVDLGHGRSGFYHVFDNTRRLAKGRAPGTAAGRSPAQGMTKVDFTYPRCHDSIGLNYEYLSNAGQIGNPTVRDPMIIDQIRRQTGHLGTLARNWRVALVAGMLKDSLYFSTSGESWYFHYSSGSNRQRINWRMPAGNKGQLDMTLRNGTTSINGGAIISAGWQTSTTNIPLQIKTINKARQAQGTSPLRYILCGTNVWDYVINNDYVQAQAGSATSPFKEFMVESGLQSDGKTPKFQQRGSIVACPGIEFIITDEGIEMGENGEDGYQPHIAVNHALFMGDPDFDGRMKLYKGGEPIAKRDGDTPQNMRGLNSWSVPRSNPTTEELFVLDNAFPINEDPYSTAYAEVANF